MAQARQVGRPAAPPTKVVRLPVSVATLARVIAARGLRAGDVDGFIDVEAVGSVGRVSAAEIEIAVLTAVQSHGGPEEANNGQDPVGAVERVVNSRDHLMLTIAGSHGATNVDGIAAEIKVTWSTQAKDTATAVESDGAPDRSHNEPLIQAIVRAHVWMDSLREGTYESIEDLADANRMHPKVVRQALRLAFLSPEVTSAVLEGRQPIDLALPQIPKLLPLKWTEQQGLLG